MQFKCIFKWNKLVKLWTESDTFSLVSTSIIAPLVRSCHSCSLESPHPRHLTCHSLINTTANTNSSSSSRMSAEQCESLEAVLEKYVPQPELAEVKRILYGKPATWVIQRGPQLWTIFTLILFESRLYSFPLDRNISLDRKLLIHSRKVTCLHLKLGKPVWRFFKCERGFPHASL